MYQDLSDTKKWALTHFINDGQDRKDLILKLYIWFYNVLKESHNYQLNLSEGVYELYDFWFQYRRGISLMITKYRNYTPNNRLSPIK